MRSHVAASFDFPSTRPTNWAWVSGFIAAGIVAAFAASASGQQADYEVVQLPQPQRFDERMVKRMQQAIRGYAMTKDPDGFGDRNLAIGFASMYVPARITDPAAVSEISELTTALTDAVVMAQRSKSPNAQDLLKNVFLGMRGVATGNYHPPGRIAAIMTLSRLNLGAPSFGQPPRVIPQNVDLLLAIYRDEANDEGVRAAALQGVRHQVSYGYPQLDDARKAKVVAAMTELLESTAPEDRSPEVHAYLQRFAVDLLGLLQGGGDKDLATKLVSLSTSRTSPDLIAFHSAARIAGMNEGLAGNVPESEVVLEKWSARMMRSFRSELERLNSFDPPTAAREQPRAARDLLKSATEPRRRRPGGAGGDMYDGGEYSEMMEPGGEDYAGGGEMGGYEMEDYDGGFAPGGEGFGRQPEAKPQPPEVLASRRHLNLIMQQLHLAVTGSAKPGTPNRPGGLLAAVDEADRGPILDWVRQMEGVVAAMNDTMLEDRKKFITAIEEQLLVLEELAGDEAIDLEPLAIEESDPAAGDAEVDAAVDNAEVDAAIDENGEAEESGEVDESAEPLPVTAAGGADPARS